jgi:hypothetical protein
MHHPFFQPKQSNVKHEVAAGVIFRDVFVIVTVRKMVNYEVSVKSHARIGEEWSG